MAQAAKKTEPKRDDPWSEVEVLPWRPSFPRWELKKVDPEERKLLIAYLALRALMISRSVE